MTKVYDEHYREELFWIWYKGGKIPVSKLYHIIPKDKYNEKPREFTLRKWAKEGWKERADALDDEIKAQIGARAIKEKVEMLTRHAGIGEEIQNIGADYIRSNPEKLNINAAVRMIVEGVRIEQASRGIGTAFKQMVDMDDEELTNKIQGLLEKSTVEIVKIEDDEESVVDGDWESEGFDK